MTTTDHDARQYVISAIENGPASRDEYDIDAIVAEFRDLADSWDLNLVDHDTFWNVVAKHANP